MSSVMRHEKQKAKYVYCILDQDNKGLTDSYF